MRFHAFARAAMVAASLTVLALFGCGGGGGGSSSGGGGTTAPGIAITDSNGRVLTASSVVASGHPLTAAVTGFGAGDRAAFLITASTGGVVTLVPGLPMCSFGSIIGVDKTGAMPPTSISTRLPAGAYTVAIYDLTGPKASPTATKKTSFSLTVADAPSGLPDVQVGTSTSGVFAANDLFGPADNVYVKATGLPANKSVKIYVVAHQDSWLNGDGLTDVSGTVSNVGPDVPSGTRGLQGTAKTVVTDSKGAIPSTLVWQNVGSEADQHQFDVVVDVNSDGRYTAAGDIIADQELGSLTVDSANRATGSTNVKLAYDDKGVAKSTFLITDNVTTRLSPHRIATKTTVCEIVVVPHKALWKDGDSLDTPGQNYGGSTEVAENFKVTVPKEILSHADLKPGSYDVIVHQALPPNFSATYNAGKDLIDGGAPGPSFTVPAIAPAKSKWTFLVYIDGDNDLYPNAATNMMEMEVANYKKSNGSQDVSVVVQLGDSNAMNFRYVMAHTTDPTKQTTVPLQSLGKKNMADPATLSQFITWGKSQCPADHYALIMWDHGSGFQSRGIVAHPANLCYAFSYSNSSLTIDQFHQALKTGGPFDMVCMDCCLMGELEIAQELQDVTPIVVASENLEPGHGYDYKFLTQVVANPAMTGADIGKQIVSYYKNFYVSTASDIDAPFTSACYDETKIPAAVSGIQGVAAALTTKDANGKTVLDDVTLRSTIFNLGYQKFTKTASYAYGDAVDWVTKVKAAVTDTTTQQACDTASAALSSAVVAEAHNATFANAHGLTIWLPKTRDRYNTLLPDYKALAFSKATTWVDLLDKLFGYVVTFTRTGGSFYGSGFPNPLPAKIDGLATGHTFVNHVSLSGIAAPTTKLALNGTDLGASADVAIDASGNTRVDVVPSHDTYARLTVQFDIYDTTGGQRTLVASGSYTFSGAGG